MWHRDEGAGGFGLRMTRSSGSPPAYQLGRGNVSVQQIELPPDVAKRCASRNSQLCRHLHGWTVDFTTLNSCSRVDLSQCGAPVQPGYVVVSSFDIQAVLSLIAVIDRARLVGRMQAFLPSRECTGVLFVGYQTTMFVRQYAKELADTAIKCAEVELWRQLV
jgi:hypothetical protein